MVTPPRRDAVIIAEQGTASERPEELTFLQGAKDCVPSLLGYISVGITAGTVGVSSRLSIMEVALMSALVQAGGAQIIICGMLTAGSPISAIIMTVFIVNLRNFLLSAAMAPQFTKYSLLKMQDSGFL